MTEYALECYRGERVTIPFAMTPAASVAGQTFLFTMTSKRNTEEKLVAPTLLTWDTVATGQGHFTLTEEMTDLKPATYYWDVWRTDEGFEQMRALGTLVILADSRVPPVE